MVRILYRKIRSRRLYANVDAFRRVTKSGMVSDVVPVVNKALAKRVRDWKVSLGFGYSITINAQGTALHVFPEGSGARYWRWVSLGVAGHPIRPRPGRVGKGGRPPALSIYRYRAKTGVGNRYGMGSWRRFQGYASYIPWWPGIAARNFEVHAANELRPEYRRLMENILRRAVRAAKREGR